MDRDGKHAGAVFFCALAQGEMMHEYAACEDLACELCDAYGDGYSAGWTYCGTAIPAVENRAHGPFGRLLGPPRGYRPCPGLEGRHLPVHVGKNR